MPYILTHHDLASATLITKDERVAKSLCKSGDRKYTSTYVHEADPRWCMLWDQRHEPGFLLAKCAPKQKYSDPRPLFNIIDRPLHEVLSGRPASRLVKREEEVLRFLEAEREVKRGWAWRVDVDSGEARAVDSRASTRTELPVYVHEVPPPSYEEAIAM